jgi:hypothetical protein
VKTNLFLTSLWRKWLYYKNADLPLAIVVTATNWHEPPRIRHQMTRQLTRFFNVLFIEKNIRNRKDEIEEISDRLIVYKPGIPLNVPIRLYANDPITHFICNSYFKNKILKFISTLNFTHLLLFNFVYDFWEIVKWKHFHYKIYICFDELPRMQRGDIKLNSAFRHYQQNLYQSYENRVARSANKCLCTHYPLLEKIKKINPDSEIFFPGHEFVVDPQNIFFHPRKAPIKVGYLGFFNWRLNLEWIYELLLSHGMILYIIGLFEKVDPAIFARYNNVVIKSPIFGAELYKQLIELDVMIMPFNPELPEVKAMTVNNKTFQYIAAGKPIVISDMPHHIEMPYGVLYRAKDKFDFVKMVRKAYEEDCEEFVKLRLGIAAENTWDVRGNKLYQMLKNSIPSIA